MAITLDQLQSDATARAMVRNTICGTERFIAGVRGEDAICAIGVSTSDFRVISLSVKLAPATERDSEALRQLRKLTDFLGLEFEVQEFIEPDLKEALSKRLEQRSARTDGRPPSPDRIAHYRNTQERKLRPGMAICGSDTGHGTLGFVGYGNGFERLITCRHVAEGQNGSVGSPNMSDPRQKIGFAIATSSPEDSTAITPQTPDRQIPPSVSPELFAEREDLPFRVTPTDFSDNVNIGDYVFKSGATSGVSVGRVADYLRIRGGVNDQWLFRIDPSTDKGYNSMSFPGDSGAPVLLLREGRPSTTLVGIVQSGSGSAHALCVRSVLQTHSCSVRLGGVVPRHGCCSSVLEGSNRR